MNYISTESLYDSGAHLSHARTYSHKYIKREPDGHGGYRYWYKTDRSSGSGPAFDTYVREKGGAFASRNANYNDAYATFQPTGNAAGWIKSRMRTANDYRQADKASKIYKEGQYKNAVDYLNNQTKNRNKASKETKPELPKEYLEALEANSQKNNYFGNGSEVNNMFTFDPKTGQTVRVDPKDYTYKKKTVKKKTVGDYAKQAIDTISTAAGSAYDSGKKFLQNLFK